MKVGGPFDDILEAPLQGRNTKPRAHGLTMIIDKSMGIREMHDLLGMAAVHIDFWKLPFGTSAFYMHETLQAKIRLCRSFGIEIYPGGTFLEAAVLQGRSEAFLQRTAELGFTAVEVSDGTITLDPLQRKSLIRTARQMGFRVISEIGKKDPLQKLNFGHVHRAIDEDLAAGAEKIIVEGRESGKSVGIYNEQGLIQEDELTKIVNGVRSVRDLIWEAPMKSQQEALILRFGANVNLGNIPPEEIFALEALRNGLRGDTLKACLNEETAQGAMERSSS